MPHIDIVDPGTYNISGIVCEGCKEVVEKAIRAVEGVTSTDVDVVAGRVKVKGCATFEAMYAAVKATGNRVLSPLGSSVITVRVGGMSCGHCSAQVEKVLAALDGVLAATVDLEAELATVIGTASTAAVVEAVEATGKTAVVVEPGSAPEPRGALAAAAKEEAMPSRMRKALGKTTTTLSVGGMSCDHCSAQVEKALAAVDGVSAVAVDLESGLATVVGTASNSALVQAVEATGKSATSAGPGATRHTFGHQDGSNRVASHDASALRLHVQGMVCEACRATIKRVLQATPGVTYVAVNLVSGIVTVSGVAPPSELILSISSAGRFRVR